MVQQNMAEALKDIINSTDSEDAKKRLIVDKYIEIDPRSMKNVVAVLKVSFEMVLHRGEFYRNRGRDIFVLWASQNLRELREFFTPDVIGDTLSITQTVNLVLLELFLHIFVLLEKDQVDLTRYFEAFHQSCLKRFGSDNHENAAVWLLVVTGKYPNCIPTRSDAVDLAVKLVESTARLEKQKLAYHQFYTTIFKRLWNKNAENEKMFTAVFSKIYALMSDKCKEPSPLLWWILETIPSSVSANVVNVLMSASGFQSNEMEYVVKRMFQWLKEPIDENVGEWIIAVLKGLALASKFSVLIKITQDESEHLLNIMENYQSYSITFVILSYLLLSYQHMPDAFHKIIPRIPNFFAKWQRDKKDDALLAQFADLVHVLMDLHPGFPEIYEPLLRTIQKFPCKASPDRVLRESKWIDTSIIESAFPLREKSDTGKTGLVNLGNSCYMNSVLQALFMTDKFRNDILQSEPRSSQGLLRKLQLTFAFLTHTIRPEFKPSDFYGISRPRWFEQFRQQDCSEYLRNLLDVLHEEELKTISTKSSAADVFHKSPKLLPQKRKNGHDSEPETPTEDPPMVFPKMKTFTNSSSDASGMGDNHVSLVHDSFAGRLVVTCRCLVCNYTSEKKETFTDLHLAFPQYAVTASAASSEPTPLPLPAPSPHNSAAGVTSIMLPDTPRFSTNNPTSSNSATTTTTNLTLNSTKDQQQFRKNAPAAAASSSSSISLNLNDLINHYLASEKLEGDNRYFCENCKCLQEAERSIQIIRTPSHMILILLRFRFDAATQRRSKILTDVKYPLELSIPLCDPPRSNTGADSTDESSLPHPPKQQILSDNNLTGRVFADKLFLYGVVIHSGTSSDGGHYYTYARSSSSAMEGEGSNGDGHAEKSPHEWFVFNDSQVAFSPFDDISSVTQRLPRDTAYVLFYKKRPPVSTCPDRDPKKADPRYVPLHEDIRNAINNDNLRFVKEREEAARKYVPQGSSSHKNNFFDSDGNNPPPGGSCGGQNGFNSGPSLVF